MFQNDLFEIFLMILYMYIAPGQVQKTTDLFEIFLMILYMYIAPGQVQKTPWGQTFDVNRQPLSLRPFVASFKKISFNSDSIHIF